MPRPAVSIRNVGKTWEIEGRPPLRAIDGLSFDVAPGEFVVLLGPSGCGKSSLLYMIAGLENVSSGVIEDDGIPISGPSPERGLIFQEASLYPWLTILDNVAFGLAVRAEMPARRKEMATAILRRVGLGDVLDKKPDELSGGMRQRAALARALAQDVEILLMDEPFGALDAMTRDLLHDELEQVWSSTGLTVVFVTHNVREAARLSDRIVLLTSLPGKVADEFPVTIQRPRRIDSTEVMGLAAAVTDRLRAEVRRHSDSD
jgi:NitT/TauT family transport system ATP-binding protein